MKELEDLNAFEKAVLLTCCDANNYSLSSHVPIEAITKRLRKALIDLGYLIEESEK